MWSGGKKPNKYFPKEAKDRKPPPSLPTPTVTLMWLNETQQQQLSCQPQHTHSVKAQLCASTVHKKIQTCSPWIGRCRPTSVFPSPHLPPQALFSLAVWAPAYIWKLLSDISDGQAFPACEVYVSIRRWLGLIQWPLILFYLAGGQQGTSSSYKGLPTLPASHSLCFFFSVALVPLL